MKDPKKAYLYRTGEEIDLHGYIPLRDFLTGLVEPMKDPASLWDPSPTGHRSEREIVTRLTNPFATILAWDEREPLGTRWNAWEGVFVFTVPDFTTSGILYGLLWRHSEEKALLISPVPLPWMADCAVDSQWTEAELNGRRAKAAA